MTDFNARIRVIVSVPFTAPGETSDERIQAAKHAETELAAKLEKALGKAGTVVEITVEEVHE